MTQPHRAHLFLAAILVTGGLVAACRGGGATPAPAVTASPATSPAASASAAADAVVVNMAEAAGGAIVVDGEGRALYLFTNDTKGDGTSVCNGACAASWPPFLAGDAPVSAGDGVTGALGTATRDDGSLQVTLDGWPLYYFAGDVAAGDTNGQGLNSVWWLVGPDGSPIDGGAGVSDGS